MYYPEQRLMQQGHSGVLRDGDLKNIRDNGIIMQEIMHVL